MAKRKFNCAYIIFILWTRIIRAGYINSNNIASTKQCSKSLTSSVEIFVHTQDDCIYSSLELFKYFLQTSDEKLIVSESPDEF